MADIRRLSTADGDFSNRLQDLLAWESVSDAQVRGTVDAIIQDLRERGDAALLEYTRRFDRWEPATGADLEIPQPRLEQAWHAIQADQQVALRLAAERIRAYADCQAMTSWSYVEDDGIHGPTDLVIGDGLPGEQGLEPVGKISFGSGESANIGHVPNL